MQKSLWFMAGLCSIGIVFFSCKSKTPQTSAVQNDTGAADSGLQVHGSNVSQAQYNELVNMIAGDPTTPNTNPTNPTDPLLGNQSETLVAQNNDVADPMADNGGFVDPMAGGDTGFALQAGDTPYMAKCRQKGVPIPPPWGDSRWVSKGDLPQGRIFALDPSLKTTLYTFTDPAVKGTCAALPRTQGGVIRALGIICQAQNGNACFWDNKEPRIQTTTGGRRFQATISDASRIRPELIADGDNLVENCTQCHRGGNVFIVHADTVLSQIDGTPDDSYNPISGQSTWSNPTGNQAVAKGCQDECHSSDGDGKAFPSEFTFGYCANVMMPSIKTERVGTDGKKLPPAMPPYEDGYSSADFAKDIQEISTKCQEIYKAAGATWDW